MPLQFSADFPLTLAQALPSNCAPARLIDPQRLAAALGLHAARVDLVAIDACASTNSLLLDVLAAAPLPADAHAPARGVLLVADQQCAGRGRRGRAWVSSPERSLTFSLAWPFARGTALSGLSLAVGVALRRALQAEGYHGVGLKWPNDVLLATGDGYAKLGGVLIELSVVGKQMQAVIGMGLNLQAPEGAGTQFGQAVAGLSDADRDGGAAASTIDRHGLLASVLRALIDVLDQFSVHGFAAFRADWNAGNAFAGRELMLIHEGRASTTGRCLGVDDAGALRVATAQGELRWLAGDVVLPDGPSLRLAGHAGHADDGLHGMSRT